MLAQFIYFISNKVLQHIILISDKQFNGKVQQFIQFQENLHNIKLSNTQMPKINKQSDIWEQLIKYTEEKPMNFKALGREYDINKLQLEKITALQLRSKRRELDQRHWDQSEEQSKTWLENQYRLFVWFFLAYMKFYDRDPQKFTQNDWNLIGGCFKKYTYVCEYFCFSCKKSKSEPWTQEEDDFIMKTMKSNMNKKWTSIGLQLYRITEKRRLRKPKAIRERWLSHLNPNIKKVDWSLQQELQLVMKIKELGKKWSKIAKQLGNRSQHTVKNRYHKIILKFKKKNQNCFDLYSEEQILNFIENQLFSKLKLQNSNKIFVKKQQTQEENIIQSSVEKDKQFVKIQNEPALDCQIRPGFAPIIIVFGGFKM